VNCCLVSRSAIAAITLFIAVSLSSHGSAESVEISVEGELSDRLVSLDVFERDGVKYVSLRSIVEQAGGAFSVLPTQARIDLYGETANVRAGSDRVHALSIFSLSHPIRQDGEHLLIAVDDLAAFFQKSFRKNVGVIGTGAMVAPRATGAPAGSAALAIPPAPRVIEAPREPGELEVLATTPAPKVPGYYGTLVIDPGHGGSDTGSQASGEVSEDEIALALAKLVKARVGNKGSIRALLTREADSELTEAQRLSAITAVRPDFVVSIHLGTALSPETSGIATFYSPPTTITTGGLLSGGVTTATIGEELSNESRRLAQAVGSALEASTASPLRGVVKAPIRALDDVNVPSILVEVGCITGPNAASTLMDPVYQGKVAEGIANGIAAFVDRQEPQPKSAETPAPAEN
jgi:N-acetylmuramoyl-L-alanine amidase